jgi:hypothetical protein
MLDNSGNLKFCQVEGNNTIRSRVTSRQREQPLQLRWRMCSSGSSREDRRSRACCSTASLVGLSCLLKRGTGGLSSIKKQVKKYMQGLLLFKNQEVVVRQKSELLDQLESGGFSLVDHLGAGN